MDPFNDDFDAKAALLSMDDEGEVPCSSLDAYENEFKNENPEYLKVVEKVEAEKIANANKSKLPNAKERMRRLETICVDGVKPLDVKPKKDIKRKVKHVDTGSGRGFACYSGGVYDCMEKWMKDRNRITLKLRSHNSHGDTNRIIEGVIIAFDKHWNLILRDIDECYMPARRLRKIQACAKAMPESVLYTSEESETSQVILTRHLSCSLIMGNSIICLYKSA